MVLHNNKSGSEILKGMTESDLINGEAVFKKVQIKEVSSHYRNGCIFIFVYAKMPSFSSDYNSRHNGSVVNFQEVKPFVIPNVIIKAKKFSKRRNLDSLNEDSIDYLSKKVKSDIT